MSKKNALEFDRSQPAFLRRLQGEISGQVDDPHRQVNPTARPSRPKRLDAEEDDGPTYVMEDTSESLTKEQYEALVKNTAEGSKADSDAHAILREKNETGLPKLTQKVASIGMAKKRKAVRLVGTEEDGDDHDGDHDSDHDAKEHSLKLGRIAAGEKDRIRNDKKGAAKKNKKRAKVNINFDDDEDENT